MGTRIIRKRIHPTVEDLHVDDVCRSKISITTNGANRTRRMLCVMAIVFVIHSRCVSSLVWNDKTLRQGPLAWRYSSKASTSTTALSFAKHSSHDNENNYQKEDRDVSSDQTRRALFAQVALSAVLTPLLGSTSIANAYVSSDEGQRIAIFEKTSPSVVFIDTFTERRDVFSTNVMEVPLGSGSGFVWDKKGHIVTNYHVVRNARVAQVAILTDGNNKQVKKIAAAAAAAASSASSGSTTTSNIVPYSSMKPTGVSSGSSPAGTVRSVFKAQVVGVDPSKDVAVLKVDAPPELLYPITVGTSSGLRVGQQSLAIGNPFGLDHTLTMGIISGIGREVKSPIGRPITNGDRRTNISFFVFGESLDFQSFKPTPPSTRVIAEVIAKLTTFSGPLLDSSGKLIGMNTAIYSPSGGSAGIGFAIPIDTVKFIVETLIRDGKVIRPVLGITFLESRQARALGIGSGVLVLEVPEGSPAAVAGLKGTRRTEAGLVEIGDIISKVGDRVINTESDLFQALEDCKVGDRVKLTVNRVTAVDDQLQVKEVVLTIELQSSADLEKNMKVFQYEMEQ